MVTANKLTKEYVSVKIIFEIMEDLLKIMK
jgi:hypothetical protein